MPIFPSLRQLHYLLALAEHLNFTRAAEACFVTQSTLSAGIKELEATIGAQLVERERHRVVMTAVGLEVVNRAQGVLAASEDLMQAAERGANPMEGVIRLGVIPTIIPFLLPTVFPEMRRCYPTLKIALKEDLTDNLLQRLNDGELDFALVALPYETGNLLAHPLFEEPLWLVAPADFFAPKQLLTQELDTERLLLLGEGHCLRGHTLSACSIKQTAAQQSQTSPILEATSLYTLVQMVNAGLGLALVPEMSLSSGLLNGTNLKTFPFAEPVPRRGIALLARPSTARREAFDALCGLITRTWEDHLRK